MINDGVYMEYLGLWVLVGIFAVFMWGLGRFISDSEADFKKYTEELKKRGRL